jgi:SAM-dependent methyltransferase
MRAGVEEPIVPELLRAAGASSVLVVGAGTGRQYEYLGDFDVSGIDLSPKLVKLCRQRYPRIETTVGDVTRLQHESVDAVVSSAVLQHVRPAQITETIDRICQVASRLVILRECTSLAAPRDYQFAHDYRALFGAPWALVHTETTDEFPDVTVELMAFTRA